jgi:branched chain amino acid aminotransferase apoenzyme (EC 2.6.1.42)
MTAFEEMEEDGVVWMNGEFVDWENATTHVMTHALHYGTGVFEGVRAYDTEQGTASSGGTNTSNGSTSRRSRTISTSATTPPS